MYILGSEGTSYVLTQVVRKVFNRPSDPLAGIVFEVCSQLELCVYVCVCVCVHLYGGELHIASKRGCSGNVRMYVHMIYV